MSKRIASVSAQTISCEQAASFVRSGMWLDYGTGLGQPDVFDIALAARGESLENVKIRSCLSMRPRAVAEGDPQGNHFFLFSWHFSGYDRKRHDAGRCNYMPLNLGEVPDYYRRFLAPVDIAILKTCPMDANGYFNFSAANLWHRAVIERAKLVIVEVSKSLPYVYGEETESMSARSITLSKATTSLRRSCPIHSPLRSTGLLRAELPPRLRMVRACRSASAACRTRCAHCCSKAASAILACTPKC